MIQQEKPLAGSMPVVWPTLLDLSRDECKRILRKLGETLKRVTSCAVVCADGELTCVACVFVSELEAYAGVISALRSRRSHQRQEGPAGKLTRVLRCHTLSLFTRPKQRSTFISSLQCL